MGMIVWLSALEIVGRFRNDSSSELGYRTQNSDFGTTFFFKGLEGVANGFIYGEWIIY